MSTGAYDPSRDRDGRDADRRDIDRALATSSDPRERAKANAARMRINNESAKVKDMREHLIRARREGNIGEVRDITETVAKRSDYQNS